MNGISPAAQQTHERWRFDSIPLVVRLTVGFWAGILCGPVVSVILVGRDDRFLFGVMMSCFLSPIGMLLAGYTGGRIGVLVRLLAVAVFCGFFSDLIFADSLLRPHAWICGGALAGLLYGCRSGRPLVALCWGFQGATAGLAGWMVWFVWMHVFLVIFMFIAMTADLLSRS